MESKEKTLVSVSTETAFFYQHIVVTIYQSKRTVAAIIILTASHDLRT
jgi:hypothetical protein